MRIKLKNNEIKIHKQPKVDELKEKANESTSSIKLLDQSSLLASQKTNPFNVTTGRSSSSRSSRQRSKVYGELPPLKLLAFDCYAQPTVTAVPKAEFDEIQTLCLTFWSNGTNNYLQRLITVDPLKCLERQHNDSRIHDEQCDEDILEVLDRFDEYYEKKERAELVKHNQTLRHQRRPVPDRKITFPSPTQLDTSDEVFVMNEIDLMSHFAEQVAYLDPDVILSWNLKTSLVYLLERSLVLGLPWYVNMLGKYYGNYGDPEKFAKTVQQKIAHGHHWGLIKGRTVYNYWHVAAGDLELRSTSFGAASEHVLGETMPKFERAEFALLWDSGRGYVIKIKRWLKVKGKRLARIVEKLGSMSLGAEISTLCNISCHAAVTRGSQIRQEGLFCEMARQFNFTLPSPSVEERKQQTAVVSLPLNMEPYSEYYTTGVTVLDFKSLYPSVIIAYNLCYSTIVGNKTKFLDKESQQLGAQKYEPVVKNMEVATRDMHTSKNGMTYVSQFTRRGFMPAMLEYLLDHRAEIKRQMKCPGLNARGKRALDFRQTAVKLVANTMYGYTAASFSGRMPLSELACSIVADSRSCTERAIDLVRAEYNLNTVYGDTDSLFVDLRMDLTTENISEAINKANEMAKFVSKRFQWPIQLKYEKVYWPCILESKKRYFGLVWEDKFIPGTFPFEAKGIETVRRDGVQATSKLLIHASKILFTSAIKGQPVAEDKMKRFLFNEFAKMASDPSRYTHDIMFSKSWRGMEGYAEGSKLGAMRIAQIRAAIDRDLIPKRSSRVPYGICEQDTCYDNENLYERTTPMMDLVEGEAVPDMKYYLEKQIGPAIDRFTGVSENLKVDIEDLIEQALTAAKDSEVFINENKCFRCKCDVKPNMFVCPKCRTRSNEKVLELVAHQYDTDFNACFAKCRKCIRDAAEADWFSSNCVNTDCSNLHKIHYLTQHRNMYFYRRTKGKLGKSEVDTTFTRNTEIVGNNNTKEATITSREPPKSTVKFTIV